jgi:hypothetical protein
VPKRKVKEEPEYVTPPAIRRRGSSSVNIREPARQQQRRVGCALLVPKPEVKGGVYSLKALMGLLSALLGALGESPRSSDRAVAALLCHSLLEDTALELTACGSSLVGWRRCEASLDDVGSSFGDLRQRLRRALPLR